MQSRLKAISSVPITFANEQTAQVIQVRQQVEIPVALQILGLQPRPTLVLIGGAGHISPADFDRIQQLFVEVLAPFAEAVGAVVVDGGTNAGVMQLIGQARSRLSATFPLVGVSPIQLVQLSDQYCAENLTATVCLEPNHTHFILVPGSQWGDESSWLAAIASAVAGNHASIAVLVNGGRVSLADVQWNIAEGRPIAVVAGSGRLADEIAVALHHPETKVRETIAAVLQTGHFRLLELSAPNSDIETFLKQQFSGARSSITSLT